MAILDTSVTGSLTIDREPDIFIGVDLPFRKSQGNQGYFESTSTTLSAVKNNVRSLLLTERGERIMQPTLGLSLKRLVFQPVTPGLLDMIKQEISDTFKKWLPFVVIKNLEVSFNSGGVDGELMGNTIIIKVDFAMDSNPNMFDSVEVEITGG